MVPINRKQQIIDALRAVIIEEGYAGATITRIARQAGITPGLVHYHFSDKAAILTAMVADLGERLAHRVAARSAAAGSAPWAQVDAWVDGLLALDETADPGAVAAWASVAAEALHRADARTVYAEWLGRGHAELRDRLAAAGVPDPDAAALAGVACIEGLIALGLTAPHLVPAGSAAPTVKRVLRSHA